MLPGEPIKGLILDSPVMDWNAPIDLGARQRGVPGWLASVGKFVVERRTGISLDDLDHVRHAKEFRQPILLFVDDDDTSVPVEPSLRFAELRPDLVTLVRTKGGGHVGSWNVDQARYERGPPGLPHRFSSFIMMSICPLREVRTCPAHC
ncbi:hypothetical protein [Nonomuraea sp. NPDC003201]